MAVTFVFCRHIFTVLLLLLVRLHSSLISTGHSDNGYDNGYDCSMLLVDNLKLNRSNIGATANATGSSPVLSFSGHAPLHISASLHCTNITLLWCRPRYYSKPFQPPAKRSISCVLCAVLLLAAGDIELNPGPDGGVLPNNILKFGCLNVNSARNKCASIHDLISDFNLDILALSETKLQHDLPDTIKNDIAPEGYDVLHVHRQPTASHPGGGGLAVVFRDSLLVRSHPLSSSLSADQFEMQLLRVTNVKPPLTVAHVYRPPSSNVVKFYDELSDALAAATTSTTDSFLLCGDLNCPGDDSTSISAELDDVFDVFDLSQHVQQPTRTGHSRDPDHLLDVVVTDVSLGVVDVVVDAAGHVSDHSLVVATLSVSGGRAARPPTPHTFRPLKQVDAADFDYRLRASELFTSPAATADEFAAQIERVAVGVLDDVAPLRTRRQRRPKATSKWLSSDAIDAKRHRRRLERHWLRTRTESDRVAYRRACRRANQLINSSRQDFFRDQLQSASNCKDRWRIAKQLLHSNRVVQNRSTDENLKLANSFASFFRDKISTLKQTVARDASTLTAPPIPDPLFSGSVFDTVRPVESSEVTKLINSIPPKSSPLDFIPTSLIKSCSSTFGDIIARLANLSFSQGHFPTKYKRAIVTPLLKKPGLDDSNPANYRPISNLNNISKLLERLFLYRFQGHVCGCSNFNPFQSAYRTHYSTETALLHTLDKIYSAADVGRPTVLVSLDLSAAFDVIDHSILLDRLQYSFGVSGTALAWLRTYLSCRQYAVRAGSSSSVFTECTTGVPQGSVLGPILFSCYTSPISNIASSHAVHLQQYADDTQIFMALTTHGLDTQLNKLTSCLSALHAWFTRNGLALNGNKSEAVLFGTRQRLRAFPPIQSVSIAGCQVLLSQTLTVLGVTLDSTLSLNKHTSSICQSMYFHMRALRHVRSALTEDTATALAVSLVQSRLDYANSILFKTSTSNINKLQRVQNTLARIALPNLWSTPVLSLLNRLHWLPVTSRIKYKLATITYKSLSVAQPTYLHQLLHQYQPIRSLRSGGQNLLALPTISSEFGRRAFSYCAPSVWNNLPLSIRSLDSFNSFKSHLKTHLFAHH